MRQRVWKRSLARCGWLLAALWVAGGAAAAAGSITFVHYFGPEQMAGLQPLIDHFEREQGATVEVVGVTSGEVVEKLQVMGAAGVFPDVVRLGSEFINLVGTGVFADLAPYIRRDGISLDAFYPATVAAFHIGGRQLALPTAISTFAYFYDADRFAEGGLTPPSHDWADTAWDWDAFIAAARKLTSRTAPERWAIQGFGDPWMWPWWWGGDWLDAASREALADTPATVRALETIAEAYRVEAVVGGSFTGGSAAAVITGNWSLGAYVRADLAFRWDLAALPMGTQRKTILYPNGLFLGASSAEKELAWAFIRQLTTEPGAAASVSQAVGRIPSLRQLGPQFIDLQARVHPGIDYRVFLDALVYAQYPTTRRVPQAFHIETLIREGWARIQSGAVPAAVEAENLDRQISVALAEG